MTKKRTAVLLVVLALFALAACYFFLPRPVIKDPETATVQLVLIQRDPYYQKDSSDRFLWIPETEEDQAAAQKIAAYLSQCQERRTLRTVPGDHPLSWKCMYILVETSSPQSTFLQVRGILLGPSQPGEANEYDKAVNISYRDAGRGVWTRFQGDLIDPDSIRAFVLEALDLPADFM